MRGFEPARPAAAAQDGRLLCLLRTLSAGTGGPAAAPCGPLHMAGQMEHVQPRDWQDAGGAPLCRSAALKLGHA